MSLPSIEELEGLTTQCLARTFTDQQVKAIIAHSRQLASLGFSDYAEREDLRTLFKEDKKKKDKKDKKKDKKKKDKKKDKKKKDKKKKDKKKKDKKKKDKKKDKKKAKKKEKKEKKKDKKRYEDELPWRPAELSLREAKELDIDEDLDDTQYVRQRLHDVREKLLRKRETSVSNFAPCMLLYSESGDSKLDAQCTLLKKASTHALRSEQCWSQYLARMDECLHHRTGEYCLRAFRPLERQCAQAGWRSLSELRKLTRLRGKESISLQ